MLVSCTLAVTTEEEEEEEVATTEDEEVLTEEVTTEGEEEVTVEEEEEETAEPAEFLVENLRINPDEIVAGEDYMVLVDVTNEGESAGGHEVVLRVNGHVAKRQEIIIGSSDTRKVTFTITEEEAGTHEIDVNGLTATLTVLEPLKPQSQRIDPSLDLGVWIESQSPDGSIIKVNGVIVSISGNVVGWSYNWGDGTTTTHFFPTIHRYNSPGSYTITVSGFDDQGHVSIVSLQHIVHPRQDSEVARVELSEYSIGLSSGEEARIGVYAYDSQGHALFLENRAIDVFNPEPEALSVEFKDSVLVVKADLSLEREYARGFLYIWVDGTEAEKPINAIVNNNLGEFRYHGAVHTGTYLPVEFFSTSVVTGEEWARIIERTFLSDLWSTRGRFEDDTPDFHGISYAPEVYGVNGNPIGLGDYALPKNGIPPFGVSFHEMGHNFSGVQMFFNSIGIPGPFYQETVAEWYDQFCLNKLLTEHVDELSSVAVMALNAQQEEGRNYHRSEYQKYVDQGRIFDYDNILSSQALVQMIFQYCDLHGWDRIQDFFDHFDLSYIPD